MTQAMIHSLVLRRLTAQDLPAIAGWFEDADTRRFLGGPEWPAAMLATAKDALWTEFRGARQTAADHYLALADGVPVGYVDCGTFDRCAIYGGEGPDGPIILDTIDAITGAIAFTIDPARRREGLATQMIRALIDHSDLGGVELFEAGVDPENQASRRTLEAAGFRLRSPERDCEEMLYYEFWAPGRPDDRCRRTQVDRVGDRPSRRRQGSRSQRYVRSSAVPYPECDIRTPSVFERPLQLDIPIATHPGDKVRQAVNPRMDPFTDRG